MIKLYVLLSLSLIKNFTSEHYFTNFSCPIFEQTKLMQIVSSMFLFRLLFWNNYKLFYIIPWEPLTLIQKGREKFMTVKNRNTYYDVKINVNTVSCWLYWSSIFSCGFNKGQRREIPIAPLGIVERNGPCFQNNWYPMIVYPAIPDYISTVLSKSYFLKVIQIWQMYNIENKWINLKF